MEAKAPPADLAIFTDPIADELTRFVQKVLAIKNLENTLELMNKCAPFDHCPNHVKLSANAEFLDPHHQAFLRFASSARQILLLAITNAHANFSF